MSKRKKKKGKKNRNGKGRFSFEKFERTIKPWDSEIEDEMCPALRKDVKAHLVLPDTIWTHIQELTKEIDTEWLGYLRGDYSDDGMSLHVKEIIIPKQEVTGASVVVKEDVNNVQGVVHSHNSMGVFFSGTDDDYINSNNAFSLVVNKKGEHEATARVKLKCGYYIRKNCDVDVMRKIDKAFMEKAKSNITEKVSEWNFDDYYYGFRSTTKEKTSSHLPLSAQGMTDEEEEKVWNYLKGDNPIWNNK